MPDENLIDDLQAESVREMHPPESGKGGFRERFSRSKPLKTQRGTASRKTDKELRDSLRNFFREVAPGLAGFAGDEYDAEVIRKNSDRLADSYVELAKASPRFRSLLEGIMAAGSPMIGAVFATAAVAVPILHHHKIISVPPFMGIPLIGEPLEVHETEPDKAEENGDKSGHYAGAGTGTPPSDAVA